GSLNITGSVPAPITFQIGDLASMPRQTITLTEPDGSKDEYEGVPVIELLKKAGVPRAANYAAKRSRPMFWQKRMMVTLWSIPWPSSIPLLLKAVSSWPTSAMASRSSIIKARCALWPALIFFPAASAAQETYRGEMPRGFPAPLIPADNPMTSVKVQLGRYL